MVDISRFARGLLVAPLPSEAVAEVVFRQASFGAPMKMGTPVSDTLARSTAKSDGWTTAATHAMSATSADLLAKLAKDSRKQVRRAVARNPHTSPDTMHDLLSWACRVEDEEAMGILVHRVELPWLLDPVRLRSYPASFPWVHLARRTQEDSVMVAHAVSAGQVHIDRELASWLRHGRIPGTSLTDVVDAWAGESYLRSSIIEAAFGLAERLDAEMVRLLLASPSIHASNLLRRNTVKVIDRDAIQLLLDADRDGYSWARELASVAVVDSDQVDELLEKPTNAVVRNLVPGRLAHLSVSQLESALAAIEGYGSTFAGVAVLQAPQSAELSDAGVLHCLRNGGRKVTVQWAAGTFPATPRPGQLAALVAHQGSAFRNEYQQTAAYEPASLPGVTLCLSQVWESVLDKPWADDFADTLGPHFLAHVGAYAPCGNYTARRMIAGLGTDPGTWALALGLLPTFEGSLTDLISMTRKLSRAEGNGAVSGA